MRAVTVRKIVFCCDFEPSERNAHRCQQLIDLVKDQNAIINRGNDRSKEKPRKTRFCDARIDFMMSYVLDFACRKPLEFGFDPPSPLQRVFAHLLICNGHMDRPPKTKNNTYLPDSPGWHTFLKYQGLLVLCAQFYRINSFKFMLCSSTIITSSSSSPS